MSGLAKEPDNFTIPKKLMDEAVDRELAKLKRIEKNTDAWVKQCKKDGIIVLKRRYVDENRCLINRIVDVSSLEIDGVDYRDAPDFCDAFFSAGQYEDGTKMSDEDLDALKENHPNLFYDLIYDHMVD